VALGVNIVERGSAGPLFFRVVDLTLDNAYAAGGYAITPAQLGFGANGVIYGVQSGVAGGFLTEWDQANKKLKCRDVSGGVGAVTPECANNLAALNGIVARVLAWGKGQG